MTVTTREWSVPIRIAVEIDTTSEGVWSSLVGQDCRHGFLTSIADIGYPKVAELCLDFIFEWGHGFSEYRDALSAYARRPLMHPPSDYYEKFEQVDWTRSFQTHHLFAIVLAGSPHEKDKAQLRGILRTVAEDFRCGPIIAASGFDDAEFVQDIATIAVGLRPGDAHATGEIHSVIAAL